MSLSRILPLPNKHICLAALTLSALFWPVLSAHAQTPANETIVRRGLYLARAGDCTACHTQPGGKPMAGGRAMTTPFGTLYTPNITPDRATGIGNWSSESFYLMMHSGRSPDGGLIYPAMPFGSYTKVTRADSDAIYAYLQTVDPVVAPNKEHDLDFPYNNRSLILGWRTLFFVEGSYTPDHTKSAIWNRGGYLVGGLGHCVMCHSEINALGGTSQSRAFEGGLIPTQNWYAPSLASDKAAGLGDWSIDDITHYLHDGVSPQGAAYGPMAEVIYNSLQYLTVDDARAIAVYLKALKQGEPPAPPDKSIPLPESSLLMHLGKVVYEGQCATCHGAHGKGVAPNYPKLAQNHSIQLDNGVNPIQMVLNGGYPPATAANPMPYGMPPFAQSLSDDEVAAVVSYIRGTWGNRGGPVAARTSSELRTFGPK